MKDQSEVPGEIGSRLPDDLRVTVCAECLKACCWQGAFYCDNAYLAKTIEMTVADLRLLRLENPEFWRPNQ